MRLIFGIIFFLGFFLLTGAGWAARPLTVGTGLSQKLAENVATDMGITVNLKGSNFDYLLTTGWTFSF